LDSCPKCGETKQPHRACAACGTYKGREVIVIKEETEE
jgi:large subunit ribosomal protein L32